MNLDFPVEQAPIVFHVEELDSRLRAVHERAIGRAQRYLVSEAELLESIIEVDQYKLYEKFGVQYLTTYCVKYLGLDENVAGILVRVARKSSTVPELKQAIVDGDVSMSNARTIASVINNENQAEWIEKAKTLSTRKLEHEVASVSPHKAKPEKPRHIGNGRVQIVLNLSEADYGRRCRLRDLVSQSLRRTATDSDAELAFMDLYEFHKDPIKKAERALNKKSKGNDTSRGGSSPPLSQVKHQVWLRDRGHCQARDEDGKICGSSQWTNMHHIVPKWRGGQDTLENFVTLCSPHHRLWHKREGC